MPRAALKSRRESRHAMNAQKSYGILPTKPPVAWTEQSSQRHVQIESQYSEARSRWLFALLATEIIETPKIQNGRQFGGFPIRASILVTVRTVEVCPNSEDSRTKTVSRTQRKDDSWEDVSGLKQWNISPLVCFGSEVWPGHLIPHGLQDQVETPTAPAFGVSA